MPVAGLRFVVVVFLIQTALTQASFAQNTLSLARLDGPVVIDGRVDEAAWDAVAPLDMTVYQPTFKAEPSERTEIRVAYDDDYVYVSGRLFDSNPNGVRANSLYRDRYSGDDTFAIVLDTFNDNESALWFFTTPAGVRFDMAVSNDANFGGGGRAMNSSWNTFWDAETTTHAEGWSAEMRIPFSSLGFQDRNGEVVMGLIAYRYIARKNERHIYPAIPPNWGMGFAKPSMAQDVVLRGVYSQKPVYLTPYVLSGVGQDAALDADLSAYKLENSYQRELGLDVKYNVTSNLTLDLTANTDFAQVEADDQQVNLSRFSLFFPEKRQFFQERAGIFDFNTGGRDRLFHSRRIGLDGDESVRILGGARLVGRIGDWDVGALSMQTARVGGLPSENFGVLRLRHNLLNENSYVGGILTSRVGHEGSYSFAYGLDGILRLWGDEFVTLQVSQTLDDHLVEVDSFDVGEATQFRVVWQRRRQAGLNYSASLSRVGNQYEPAVGFRSRSDYLYPRAEIGFGWFAGEASPIRQVQTSVQGFVYFRNTDGSVESAEFGHEWDVDLKSGASIQIEAELAVEDLEEELTFNDDAAVPAGRYTFTKADLSYRLPDGTMFRGRASVGAGGFYDGRAVEVRASPTWALSRYVEVGAEASLNMIAFPNRDQEFNFLLAGVRGQLAFNRKISTTVFVQHNSASKFTSTNVRFRYNFREGNDLWVVYDQGDNWDRTREVPTLSKTERRNLILKYTHTFRQ